MTDVHNNEAFATVEHNGIEFPQRFEPRCNTCRHSARLLIENWWVEGLRPAQIIERLGEDPGINERNISAHMNAGHARTPEIDLMLQRAADQGVTLEVYEQNKRTEIFAAELAVDKFRARLADPEFQPDFKDGLAAIKLLNELSGATTSDGFDANEVFVVLSTFLAHTRTVLTRYIPMQVEDAMRSLGILFEQDPVLRQLIQQSKEEEVSTSLDERDPDDYVDAEVVNESARRVDDLDRTVVSSLEEEGPWDSYFEK